MAKPRNDRTNAVTKFCLSMEEHRRTEAGRVRTAREFVANFFPYDDSGATDKLFHQMPQDVRGPVLSQWGIRGAKAALKDDDAKVKNVVHDALVAGDIDETIFEEGVTAPILVDWVPLSDWWSFWRHGKLTGVAIQRALATARELEIIDDRWFLTNVQGRGGKLKGTDVVCDTLSKDQIVAWMRKLHESGDGTPAGLINSLGWETVLAKTAQDALLFALDAFAKKAGLVADVADNTSPASRKDDAMAASSRNSQQLRDAKTEVPHVGVGEERESRDSGLPVAIPDIPAIDAGDEDEDDEPPSTPSAGENALWGSTGESPKLVEARAKMMEMLGTGGGDAVPPSMQEGWAASDVPEKSSALEWPEPPPIVVAAEEKPGPPPVPKKVPAPTPRR